MKLTIPLHSSKMFTWSGGVGLIDESDFGRVPYASALYDDAIDMGFQVYSERTGKVLTFTCSSTYIDQDGDLLHRCWLSDDDKVLIKIFND